MRSLSPRSSSRRLLTFSSPRRFTPTFDQNASTDQWFSSVTAAGAPGGEFHIQVSFKVAQNDQPMTIDAFDLLKVIGKGSFGKVSLLSELRAVADRGSGRGKEERRNGGSTNAEAL